MYSCKEIYSLFIDTSAARKTHLALWRNSELCEHICDSQMPAEIIARIMAKNAQKLTQLKFITTILGPGSYTNLRLGISAVKALAYALQIPVITLDWLQIRGALYIAKQGEKKHNLLPIIHAIRDYFCLQVLSEIPEKLSMSAPIRLRQSEIPEFAEKYYPYVCLPIVIEGESFPELPQLELASPLFIHANYADLLPQIHRIATAKYLENLANIKHNPANNLDFSPLYFSAPITQ